MKNITNQFIFRTIYFAFSFITAIPLLAQVPEFDNDKPAAIYNNQFSQAFNTTWDGPKFYSQQNAMEAIFLRQLISPMDFYSLFGFQSTYSENKLQL